MSPVTALIADDEHAPRAHLAGVLRTAWPELELVAECVNGTDAWDAFLEREPQVCFLDVRMPGLTGIEVAQRIGDAAQVVFVTAPGDQAVAAFDAAGVDHVPKPVDPQRLALAVERVKARLAAPAGAPADLRSLLDRLAGQVRRPAPLDVLRTGSGADVRLVPLDEVVYFEAEARHTRVVLAGGDAVLHAPLKELLAELDTQRFRQIQRSVIVNRQHVVGTVRGEEGQLLLTLRGRSERLPVAPHFQGLFSGPQEA